MFTIRNTRTVVQKTDKCEPSPWQIAVTNRTPARRRFVAAAASRRPTEVLQRSVAAASIIITTYSQFGEHSTVSQILTLLLTTNAAFASLID